MFAEKNKIIARSVRSFVAFVLLVTFVSASALAFGTSVEVLRAERHIVTGVQTEIAQNREGTGSLLERLLAAFLSDLFRRAEEEMKNVSQPLEELLQPVRERGAFLAFFPDPKLALAVAEQFPGRNIDAIVTARELAAIEAPFDASGRGISDIYGMQYLTGLTEVFLDDNHLVDLWPLAGLTGLQVLSAQDQVVVQDTQNRADLRSMQVTPIINFTGEELEPRNFVPAEGVFSADEGTVSWEKIPREVTAVQYGWSAPTINEHVFSGRVSLQLFGAAPLFQTAVFHGNGGYPVHQSAEARVGEKYATVFAQIIAPEREGYHFIGWFTAPEMGELITSRDTVAEERVRVLYAWWGQTGSRP